MALSSAYREYMSSSSWSAAKRRHWQSTWTLKSCVVCGARRGRRTMDMHHLAYRFRGHGHSRVMLDPRPWQLVPACAKPCHRWMVTPLSHHPRTRVVVFVVLAIFAIYIGAPPVGAAVATASAIALPRIPEATFLCFVLGFPIRVCRWAGRIVGGILRMLIGSTWRIYRSAR